MSLTPSPLKKLLSSAVTKEALGSSMEVEGGSRRGLALAEEVSSELRS